MSGDRVDIYIYAGHGKTAPAPVPVGVNGVVYYIPRAKKVNVPVEVVGVLQNAVTDVHEPRGDNKGVDIRQAPATRSGSSARCKPVGTASAVPIQKRSHGALSNGPDPPNHKTLRGRHGSRNDCIDHRTRRHFAG